MYTGRYNHPEIGLMYFRSRYYSPQLGQFISRDPLGFVDGMSLYRAYFVPGGLDPSGLWFGSFLSGVAQGVVGAVVVAGVAAAAVTLGAPIGVVTAAVAVVGVAGAAVLIADSVLDPSPDNLAENAGVLVGGLGTGRVIGRPLACKLSPPNNQPPPGGINMGHEASQGMQVFPGQSVGQAVSAVMGQGPTLGGATGAVGTGSGLSQTGDAINNF